MEEMDEMECLVPVEYKDRRETKEWQVLLDQGVEGWSTQGGGKAAVQMSQVPHWCMLGGLVEHTIHKREEQPTTFACLMIQTISATSLEFKDTTMCMEQSMRQGEDHCQLLPSTMFPVLCAMLQQGWQSQ